MVVERTTGTIRHHRFADLGALLGPGDLLVMNDTWVYPARAVGRKDTTGGRVEVLFLREVSSGPETWEVLARSRLRVGQRIRFEGGIIAQVMGQPQGGWHLWIATGGPLLSRLEQIGLVPLPPYMSRAAEPADRERYQTVYARRRAGEPGDAPPGSVAAPTAGLHFSERLLDALAARGVAATSLTLHIGPATFRLPRGRPASGPDATDPACEPEYLEITSATARAVASARRVVAVGTSTVRALETMGATGSEMPITGWTRLVIAPGHAFRMVGALITNFHLPGSTPLRLTAAFAGETVLRHAYAAAMEARYRLLSYGDAMLIV